MKMIKRIAWILLAAMLFVVCFPVNGHMAADAKTRLTISYQEDANSIKDVSFSVYRVADENLKTTQEFARFSVTDLKQWSTLAPVLEGYAQQKGLTPIAAGKTDENGMLVFEDLSYGVYLISGSFCVRGNKTYESDPFLVKIYDMDDEESIWDYDVLVEPKYETNVFSSETVERKVLKIWDDDGYRKKRPKELTVYLLRNGEIYETVKLTEKNNWRYHWENLDAKYRWTIAEEIPNGYTAKTTRTGITFVLTNSLQGKPMPTSSGTRPGKLPQTGQLWWPVPVLLALGIVLVACGIHHRKKV